jgi:hypothetical protein
VRVQLRPGAADRGEPPAPGARRAAPRRRASDWLVPAAPQFPPDAPQTPAHFARPAAWLKKLRPCGTPAYWFGRLVHEWDLVHRRFGRRLVVGFDRVPADLSWCGVPGRCSTFKDPVEWHDFVRTVTAFLIERYGRACLDFYWSIANEPDLRPLFWEEGDAELFEVYDVAVDAILRAFEDHDLPSESVKVGGLELGALAARPPLLELFYTHCSPQLDDAVLLPADSPRDAVDVARVELNVALREPRLEARRSRRVEALAKSHEGRGSPCDFVSLHEYKHAAFAIEQLEWARRRALEIDPGFFADLAVVSFETDPDWLPTRDPATRAMFLGNGFWPAWAADWTRRAIAAAFDDPGFAAHEALLTVWPVERNLSGLPVLSTILDRLNDDGTTTSVTIPKDVLHLLTCLGWMSTDYFLLRPATGADATAPGAGPPVERTSRGVVPGARPPGERSGSGNLPPGHGRASGPDPAASGASRPAGPTGDSAAPRMIAGFGATADGELGLLLYSHDSLDPENRDAQVQRVRVVVEQVPFERALLESRALDAENGSMWPIARAQLDGLPRDQFTPAEIAALERAARFEPVEPERPIELSGGVLRLETALPPNGLKFFRVRRRDH